MAVTSGSIATYLERPRVTLRRNSFVFDLYNLAAESTAIIDHQFTGLSARTPADGYPYQEVRLELSAGQELMIELVDGSERLGREGFMSVRGPEGFFQQVNLMDGQAHHAVVAPRAGVYWLAVGVMRPESLRNAISLRIDLHETIPEEGQG